MSRRKITFIQDNIRAFYRMRIICPIILIVVLVALSVATPVKTMFKPREAQRGASLEQLYEDNDTYLNVALDDLNFTGYTNESMGNVRGYYYYAKWGKKYVIVLVSPNSCQQGISHMDRYEARVKIEPEPKAFDKLFPLLAMDLKWNSSGISDHMESCLLSEPSAHGFAVYASLLVYAVAFIYGVVNFIAYLVYMINPLLSPFCRTLGKKKEAKERMEQAEEELSQRPQLASEDVFITENFFVEASETEFCIVPLKEIIWIYRHAGLHFIFGKVRPVQEALYVITKTQGPFKCVALRQEDIDGVIDYLSEANKEILIGYTEENRIKAEQIKKEAKHYE